MVGKTERVQRLVEPITASITGKHPSGSIAAVSSRCQSDNQQPGVRITKARQWFCPITCPLVAAWRIFCRGFTPAYEARAFAAFYDATVQLLEIDHVTGEKYSRDSITTDE